MREFCDLEVSKPQNGAFSVQKLASFYGMPVEALELIQKFDEANDPNPKPEFNELTVFLNINSNNIKETLLYALTSGTAYVIEKGEIYIWYKPFQRMEGSGFFKLKRFMFLYGGRSVKYILDGNTMLPNKE